MTRRRCWQAEVRYPGGGTFIFGVTARDLPRAERKATERAAEVPAAGQLTVVRLYGPHHPLHRLRRPA